MEFSTVVLARGINVGGKNRLPMAEFRSAITSTGGGECATYIQSGNAVCAHPVETGALAEDIERRAGFRPMIVSLTASDFLAALAASPFDLADGDGRSTHLYFAHHPIEFDIDGARQTAAPTERIAHTGRCVYLSAPDGVARSRLAASVERFASAALTARNARTALAIRNLLGVDGGG